MCSYGALCAREETVWIPLAGTPEVVGVLCVASSGRGGRGVV